MILILIKDILMEMTSSFNIFFLKRKKYKKKDIRKRLYTQILDILKREEEIVLCKDFCISEDEYQDYTTLKYLFTKNKSTFVYNKNSDKYLYYYYDFNAHKEGFIDEWIEEIKVMFINENVSIKESTFETDEDIKDVLVISMI